MDNKRERFRSLVHLANTEERAATLYCKMMIGDGMSEIINNLWGDLGEFYADEEDEEDATLDIGIEYLEDLASKELDKQIEETLTLTTNN